ncbi:hypothetical protein NUW58_g5708 [Xylaria curta]|uniref:Uncharacterized protein n=1 Tax=Xylaria curta TaxID=42375 RepID=A0ACC1P1T7_9PEZI|nr:hypothetical protein NUW58_g5708 [Xylaria curta]
MIHSGRGGRGVIPFRRVPLTNGPERPPELRNTLARTPKECVEVKGILSEATKFPPELIDIVMDFAEYWACLVTSIDYSMTANGHLAIHGGGDRESKLLLRTEPLGLTAWHSDDQDRWQAAAPARTLDEGYPQEELEAFMEGPPSTLEHPARKIVFDIVSRDQGWSHAVETHHTFRESWTWFEAGIDRFDKGHTRSAENSEKLGSESSSSPAEGPTTGAIRPVWPPLKENSYEYHHSLHPVPDHMIQSNRVAEHDWQPHHIEWLWSDNIDPKSSAAQDLRTNGRGSGTGDGSFLKSLKIGDMVTVETMRHINLLPLAVALATAVVVPDDATAQQLGLEIERPAAEEAEKPEDTASEWWLNVLRTKEHPHPSPHSSTLVEHAT